MHLSDAKKQEIRAAAQLAELSYEFSKHHHDLFPQQLLLPTDSGEMLFYTVHSFKTDSQLYAYYALPRDPHNTEVKVIFRGTDPSLNRQGAESCLINLESWGAGVETFEKEHEALFHDFISQLEQHYGAAVPALSLHVTGHSQGGSFVQLFVNEFLRERLVNKHFDPFHTLTMSLFCSSGVPPYVAEKCDLRAEWQAKCDKPLNIVVNIGLVISDPVPYTGLDMVLVRMLYPLVDVSLLVLTQFDRNWFECLENGIQWNEIAQFFRYNLNSFLAAHPIVNFSTQLDTPYLFYNNRSPEDSALILRHVLNKTLVNTSTGYYVLRDAFNDLDLLTELIHLREHSINFVGWLRDKLYRRQSESPALPRALEAQEERGPGESTLSGRPS